VEGGTTISKQPRERSNIRKYVDTPKKVVSNAGINYTIAKEPRKKRKCSTLQ